MIKNTHTWAWKK